jgi:hypothetical protein
MVREGIVLGHLISERGIEVDRAKIEVIEQLPPPVNVKGIRSFLGHAGFYRRLRTMCGSRIGGWSLPGVMSD